MRPDEQPVGGADDARLGDAGPSGRWPRRARRRATSRTSRRANATSCSSPADSGGAAGAEHGVETVGQAGRPSRRGRARRPRLASALARQVGEQGDVLGERAGQDLGPLGDDPDGRAQLLEVEVEHVDAAEQDACPRSGSTARESSEARVDLPEPVRPTSAQVAPGRHLRGRRRAEREAVPSA